MKNYTAILDIGKTNKKIVIFDEQLNIIRELETQLPQIEDEDGFECEDISLLTSWVKDSVKNLCDEYGSKLAYLNFATYGASLIHIDEQGHVLTPLYNYLKPVSKNIEDNFYNHNQLERELTTSSPRQGFLNSGFQLFWLKQSKGHLYNRIKYTLHLPQYVSYLYTGEVYSEYTSIGCHTGLWDFRNSSYHQDIIEQGLDKKFPIIKHGSQFEKKNIHGHSMNVGIGIHDTSASLLPYTLKSNESYVLISTGTWSVCICPSNKELLTINDLENDTLHYMDIDGNSVRASKFMIGKIYENGINSILNQFEGNRDNLNNIKFDNSIFIQCQNSISPKTMEQAYHCMMYEIVLKQIDSLKRACGKVNISLGYVEGGFINNECFLQMLIRLLPHISWYKSQHKNGTAMGAACVMHLDKIKNKELDLNLDISKIELK